MWSMGISCYNGDTKWNTITYTSVTQRMSGLRRKTSSIISIRSLSLRLTPVVLLKTRNAKKYFTQEDDGLSQSWDNEIVFCNPPYGRELRHWVKKAHDAKGGKVVMLIPARTDTIYFHEYIYSKAEIRFIRGRLKFGDSKNSAPFPSMVLVFPPTGLLWNKE